MAQGQWYQGQSSDGIDFVRRHLITDRVDMYIQSVMVEVMEKQEGNQ